MDDRETFRLPGEGDAGIECPKCGCTHFEVIRTIRGDDEIRRQRACRTCGRRVTTIERTLLRVALSEKREEN